MYQTVLRNSYDAPRERLVRYGHQPNMDVSPAKLEFPPQQSNTGGSERREHRLLRRMPYLGMSVSGRAGDHCGEQVSQQAEEEGHVLRNEL